MTPWHDGTARVYKATEDGPNPLPVSMPLSPCLYKKLVVSWKSGFGAGTGVSETRRRHCILGRESHLALASTNLLGS
jgi:hypothetical protein